MIPDSIEEKLATLSAAISAGDFTEIKVAAADVLMGTVAGDFWVMYTLRNNKLSDPDYVAFHKKYNLHVFKSKAAAKAQVDEWNAKQREEYRTHPWWGSFEESGLQAHYERRDRVPLQYIRGDL